MDAVQQSELLKSVMLILEDEFFRKCSNSALIVEFPITEKDWTYLSPATTKQLKQALIKYKMRIKL